MARYAVLDIGGTNFRIGLFDSDTGALTDITRVPVESFLANPGATPSQLFDKLFRQMLHHIRMLAGRFRIAGIGVAFPGPVNHKGEVHNAPTLWGDTLGGVALQDLLQLEVGVPVVVLNDISAAVYRYQPRFDEDFCVLTISSGIGNKVFAGGRILVNAQGLGGEMGHHRVVDGDDAPPCDCGGRGHLSAVASGRGAERLARQWAGQDPTRFRESALWHLTDGDVERIDAYALVSAIREDDALAHDVLAFGQTHLAACMAMLYNAIGVKRFVLIGGFCLALGEHYLSALRTRLACCDLFGLSAAERQSMVQLGEQDDDHSLQGLAAYFRQQPVSE